MKIFSRKMAKALADREPVELEVADWDARARVRYMTGAERLDYLKSLTEGANGDEQVRGFNAMVRLLMWTLVDERGERVFAEEDFELASGLPLIGLRQVAEESSRMNGFNIEDAEGKLEPSPS